jgi:hypothetical protein
VAGFLVALVLLLIGGVVLVSGFGSNAGLERKLEAGDSADVRLSMARDALIGIAVGNIADDSGRPGQLPSPDTLADGNYDGNANNTSCLDAANAPNGLPALGSDGENYRCLGRLPWKRLGIAAPDIDEYDAAGAMPWYAVSANLADNNTCLEFINPTTVAATPVTFACPSASAPPFPWLTVCDQTGKILSNRVAFVLIAPGLPIVTEGRTQARTGTPRPQPRDYLDAIPTPSGWSALAANERCSAFDNAGLTNEFVAADGVAGFNDRLIYVTIDDLMATVEQRVAQQVRESLVTYGTAYSRFPSLAPLGIPTSVTSSFIASGGNLSGLVPFHSDQSGYRFLTEMTWNIPTTSDTVSPATSSSPSFFCFGGFFQCRIRTSPGTATIPRTVTTADFAALKNSSVATPSISCQYSGNAGVECDVYSYTITNAVTYNVQYRFIGTSTYFYYGSFSGTRTRTVTLGPLTKTGTAATPTADGFGIMRRSVTTGSVTAFGTLSAVDRWMPDALGSAPFDLTGSFPLQTGSATTNGDAVQTFSNIRLYPFLPKWYVKEKWYEHIYAAMSPDVNPVAGGTACSANCFTVGTRNGIALVVISAGAALGGQNRSSASPGASDFLESSNATGAANRVFVEPGNRYTSTYADSIATIPR